MYVNIHWRQTYESASDVLEKQSTYRLSILLGHERLILCTPFPHFVPGFEKELSCGITKRIHLLSYPNDRSQLILRYFFPLFFSLINNTSWKVFILCNCKWLPQSLSGHAKGSGKFLNLMSKLLHFGSAGQIVFECLETLGVSSWEEKGN